MNINYEYYKIFYYVAKYKSFTRAAEELNNNQPNISRVIKLLEHELGCRLLKRTNHGIILTPEGKILYSHIKIAIDRIMQAEDELLSITNLHDGVITIGASETALYMALLPSLNKFKKSHPGIRINIKNHLTKEAVESVKNGMVDFSIVTTHKDLPKPLISTTIMEIKDILVGGPSYQFTNEPISRKDIEQLPLICMGEETMVYELYFNYFKENGLTFKPEFEAATTDQILPMIINDLGIGFIPKMYAADALKKKKVYEIKIKEDIPVRKICLVENSEYPLSIAATELKNELKK